MKKFAALIPLLLSLACGAPTDQPQETDSVLASTPAPSTYQHPPTLFPGREWARSTPAEVGVDSTALAAALSLIDTHSLDNGLDETLVIRHGRVIWAGDSVSRRHDIWSCTKSFTSTIAGLLEAEGRLRLDQPVAEHEPLLARRYGTATYEHFLTMCSGYNAVGDSRWGEDSRDWSPTPFRPGEPLFPPGTAYAYWDEAMIMLGRALTQVAGTSLENYAAEKFLLPIGLRDWEWWSEEALPDGTPINFGGTGLRMSALDHARFGLLLLNDGVWDGKRLLPSGWAARACRNQVPAELPVADTDRRATDGTGTYGYNWWVINAADGVSPVDAAYTSGLNHNVCLIVPAWNLILVRQGTDGNPEYGKQRLYSEVLRVLGDGVD